LCVEKREINTFGPKVYIFFKKGNKKKVLKLLLRKEEKDKRNESTVEWRPTEENCNLSSQESGISANNKKLGLALLEFDP
jgi:hypothetical protein